jgi:hypothetical protein
MPNPTIDLQRDCELFVDFDSDYFDSQRDKILDRSGNGRHPEASGGPTLGANGPDNFEAASFDGSDDKFSLNSFNETGKIPVGEKLTASVLFTVPSGSSGGTLIGARSRSDFEGWKVTIENNNSTLEVSTVFIDNGDLVSIVPNSPPLGSVDEAILFQIKINNDDGIIKELSNGDLIRETNYSVDGPVIPDEDESILGSDATGSDGFFEGNVSFVTIHSRELNSAEDAELTRLTEPRRAQL